MIRDFKKFDIDEIVRIYTLEYKAMPAEIESLKSASKILVYDDNGIQGFIRLEMSGTYCYVEMGATTNELIKSVGLKLWEEAKKLFIQNSIKFIEVFHVKDNLNWQQLFNEIGFEYWYSVNRLAYKGTKFSESNISVIKYEDKYYEDKIRLESEAFSTLRRENDIKPYNWYLSASKNAIENNRKVTLKEKEYIYLFFENNEIVGASMVKNAEIDLLFVNIKYQGKGYGKRILEYTVNRGLEQNATGVNLNAVASNEKALTLYKKLGFKVIQAQDVRRLIIK
ncbi:GNAT family N-acetyltransferase [Abyssisolibacter fermentans]|uniref:GNAT family N-acetyltransferase n=1 Tax=Abyssisolibacter fermentans TaxID=1766203 RepID=UPI0008308DD6|nr:GNAT family N-acetyltransferase [Abyssisolibacter fermentans]